MRCERYWREGVLLVEQGVPDLHRESCLDCRRAHETRGELVRAFRFVGAGGGDPRWQARVWRALDKTGPRPVLRRWVPWASAAMAACALVLLVTTGLFRRGEVPEPGSEERQPTIEIIKSPIIVRAPDPQGVVVPERVGRGDRVRIWVRATQEARIYRNDKLLLRCTAATMSTPGCSRADGGVVAEYTFKDGGKYQLVIVPEPQVQGGAPVRYDSPVKGPSGSLDQDLAEITMSGSLYQIHHISVE